MVTIKKRKSFKEWYRESWGHKIPFWGVIIALVALSINIIMHVINIPMWKQLEHFYSRHKQLIEVKDISETQSKDDTLMRELYGAIMLCNQTYDRIKLTIEKSHNLPCAFKVRFMNENSMKYRQIVNTISDIGEDYVLTTQKFGQEQISSFITIFSILIEKPESTFNLTLNSYKQHLADFNEERKKFKEVLDLRLERARKAKDPQKAAVLEMCKLYKSRDFLNYEDAFKNHLEETAKFYEKVYNYSLKY